MSAYTRNWLERTPPDTAADILAGIAEDAQAEPRAPLSVLATVFASSGLATSDSIAGKGPGARRAGARAALMLAKMGDARAIAPLARVFDIGWLWQSKYQTEVEAALTRLLSGAEDWPEARPYDAEIRRLVERIWSANNPQRHDLSAPHTGLLLAALPYLHAVGGEPNTALLRMIAESRARGSNRQAVQKAARER